MSKVLPVVKAAEEKNEKNISIRDQPGLLKQKLDCNVSAVTPPVLPRGCRPLAHQVAGHRYGKGRLGIGMLQHMDGSILKPVQPPPRGEREVSFYKKLFDSSCEDPVLLTLRPFLPKLLGIWIPPTISSAPGEKSSPIYSYLKLEDACRRFRNPSILDIKIGKVSYDPEANDKKKQIESAKYPPLSEVGFQLLGMRISGQSPNEAVFYGKDYGWSLTKDKISEGLDLFLSGNSAWKKYIVKAFVQRLEMILSWFESQQRYQFYSSSLLLIYEGEFLDGSSDSDEEFIHKYRQMQIPSMHTESYLATIRRFLNKSTEEDQTNNSAPSENSEEIPSKSNSGDKKSASLDGGDEETTLSDAKPTDTSSVRSDVIGEMRPPENNSMPSTGHESGYSSEVDSKLSKRRCSANLQKDFVASLNRRIQESTRGVHKYRFPPEIVDVKMIDFAHVFEETKLDDNYIFGLRNLIHHFRLILKNL